MISTGIAIVATMKANPTSTNTNGAQLIESNTTLEDMCPQSKYPANDSLRGRQTSVKNQMALGWAMEWPGTADSGCGALGAAAGRVIAGSQ